MIILQIQVRYKKKGSFITFNGEIFELPVLCFRGGGIKCELAHTNLVNFVQINIILVDNVPLILKMAIEIKS